MDVESVKVTARGRWLEIFGAQGVPGDILDGRHHPCPRCGGKDRFRLIDQEQGALFCNKCFSTGCGDGLAAIQWLNGCDFKEALTLVAQHLGMGNGKPRQNQSWTLADAFCLAKKIKKETLRQFGGHIVQGKDEERIQVPMHGPDGQECSCAYFSLSSAKLSKGLNAPKRPAGLFWVAQPTPGEAVIICEGVKDAAALTEMGYTAVGLPGKVLADKFALLFFDCKVTIVPDREVGAEQEALQTAARLFGKAKQVRLASLPGPIKEKEGNDVRDIRAKEGGETLVRQAIELAPIWTPEGLLTRPIITSLADAGSQYLEALAAGITGLSSTGLAELDWAIGGGVAQSEMIVIAARPGHGKSAFALQWLVEASRQGTPGLIISQEMSALAIGKRSIQHLTSIPADLWLKDMAVVRSHIDDHHDQAAPVYIVEGCSDVSAACEIIRQEVEEHKIGIVAIDYLQMLRGEGRSRYEQVSDTSMRLKGIAGEQKLIVLAVCQLGRDIEKRNKMVPQMTDIKESGQIEQDADVIMALQWPLRYDPTYKPRDSYRISIFKVRNREMREQRIELSFDPARQLFKPQLDDEYAADADFYGTIE